MEYLIPIIISVIGLALGYFFGKSFGEKSVQSQINNAKVEAERILLGAESEGESIKKDKIFEAKEKFQQLKSDTNKELSKKRQTLEDKERKFKQRENSFKQNVNNFKNKEKEIEKLKKSFEDKNQGVIQKKKEFDEKKKEFDGEKKEFNAKKETLEKELKAEIELKKQENLEQKEAFQKRKEELEKEAEEAKSKLAAKLETVAGLTREEAKNQLIETMTKQAETEAMAYVKDKMDEAKITATKDAKKIIIQTIQRTAAEQAIENAVTVFHLDSDDIKGQIIGREGRNIRALEAATGVEIIVDDTPEAVIISGYDPLRREIARLSLKRLVADGRIHPARIEEIVNKTRKQLEQEIVEIGERTVIELNIHGLHPQLIRLVGKMRFRSSYGQNLLQHSKETAKICSIMASELKLSKKSVRMAKRAGLLHDIGKVAEEYEELSHALAGMEIAKKYNEKEPILNAIGAHHDELEMSHMISPIVQACDAISGSRPGARREILESYLKRIKELEDLATNYQGVQKAYAIQAGRELRVIVESEKVTDQKVDELSFEISQKIQKEMQYPGQIKVVVIREKRAVNFAK